MALPVRPLHIAVEGCGHGELHAIYTSVQKSCQAKGWDGVDVLIIGGDFQACRNNHDMNWMAVPPKYRKIHDFHEYYSGKRTAPYLTIFIGGNHEASNHLQELYYGGWVAPNIYYMGATNVVNVGGVRIAGLSGIWKGYDYRKPHYHLSTLGSSDVKGIYHTREIDIRKLLQIRTQVGIGLSHDWPKRIEADGNVSQLLKVKPFFAEDIKSGKLGSTAARYALDHLRPHYWFSAHLHVKFQAVVHHQRRRDDDEKTPQIQHNPDELALDDDSNQENGNSESLPAVDNVGTGGQQSDSPGKTAQDSIANNVTCFLALDKCLPKRHFLQLLEIPRDQASVSESNASADRFCYDTEWLAITRVFADDCRHKNIRDIDSSSAPPDQGRAHYQALIDKELQWVEDNVAKQGKLQIPRDFQPVAPVFNPHDRPKNANDRPEIQANMHTDNFCKMLGIPHPLS